MKTLKTILSNLFNEDVKRITSWANNLRDEDISTATVVSYALVALLYVLYKLLWLTIIVCALFPVYVFAAVRPHWAMVLYPIVFVPLIVTFFIAYSKNDDKGKKKKASKRSRNR